MKRHQRLSLLAILLLSLVCSGWMYIALIPLNNGLSGLDLQFIDDFLGVLQPTRESESSNSEVTRTMSLPHGLQTDSSPMSQAFRPFSDIYVISLPHRQDRRLGMERVREVISMNWTYVDAIHAEASFISGIVQQAVQNQADRSSNRWYPQEFSWPDDLLSDTPRTGNSLTVDALVMAASGRADIGAQPSPAIPDAWKADSLIHQTAEPIPLTCAIGNKTSGPPWERSLPPYLVLSAPKFACWYSHVQVLQKIAQTTSTAANTDRDGLGEAFLILEDDVDMERDFYDRVRVAWYALPVDWDMLFLGTSSYNIDISVLHARLGHCWSNESYWPVARGSSATNLSTEVSVHPSYAPKCTHAYAVSRHGARKLLAHLRYPPFEYSRALDQAYSWLIQSGRIKSYSIVPSIVVQRKVLSSDVDAGETGMGSAWREQLVNGVF